MVTIPAVPDSGDAHAMDAMAYDAPIATPATTACVVEISIFMMICVASPSDLIPIMLRRRQFI